MALIMVLNDGETYSNLANCKIVEVPDNIDNDDIEWRLKDDYLELKVVTTFQADEGEDAIFPTLVDLVRYETAGDPHPQWTLDAIAENLEVE